MTIEALWYSSFRYGKPPLMRRLCRQPLARQWTAAIDLAIAYAAGEAGYRASGRITLTREETWYWPQYEGDWWLIPHRVERRALALYEAATRCELARGRGSATGEAIVARLERWRETVHWRRLAATIHPRHGKRSSYRDSFPSDGGPTRGRSGKLSDTARLAIRKAKGRESAKVLAAQHGVTTMTIYNIWKQPCPS